MGKKKEAKFTVKPDYGFIGMKMVENYQKEIILVEKEKVYGFLGGQMVRWKLSKWKTRRIMDFLVVKWSKNDRRKLRGKTIKNTIF